MFAAIKSALVRGYNKLKEVSSNAVAQVGTGIAVLGGSVMSGKAMAQSTDYAATAATQIGTVSVQFGTVYAAAFTVMMGIVIAMVVWKYAKRLGSKV